MVQSSQDGNAGNVARGQCHGNSDSSAGVCTENVNPDVVLIKSAKDGV